MQVCLCTISYRERLLDVALEAAARIGFPAVELWGREPHVSEEYDESRLRGVRTMAEECGLSIPVLGSYLYLGKTAHREDTITLVDTLHNAHGLHTSIVRVWASDVGSAGASDEVWETTIAEAQEACDRAAKMNVVFAAEMHDDTLADTGASAKRLVEEVDRPNFRLNYQPATKPGTEDSLARLELVLPHVVHVHCQNFVGLSADPGYQRVQLNAGYVDYRALVERLRDAGYAGHLAVEFAAEEGDGKEASLKQDLEFLCSL
jgi:3-dehydroshikimate dehydratase